MLGNRFYFASIRKITAAFGTLFNDIHIARFNKNDTIKSTLKIPLSYGPKQKYLQRLNQRSSQNTVGAKTQNILPRMSFELVGMQMEQSSQLPHTTKISVPIAGNANSFKTVFQPVPYDINIDLHIMTKHLDDGLQILEQILPYFKPALSVSIDEVPDMGIIRDIKYILQSVSAEDNYEGGLEEDKRVLTWTISFVAKMYFYQGTSDTKVIKSLVTNIYEDPDLLEKLEIVTVKVNPITANYDDVDTNGDSTWDITETITDPV